MFDKQHTMRQDDHAEESGISGLTNHLSEHLETRFEYAKLHLIEKATMAYARHLSAGMLMHLVWMFLLFVSTGIALWIGSAYESYAIGFSIVGGAYLIFTLVFIALRKPVIEKKMIDSLVADLCKEEDNDDEDEDA
jgi:hypothetical protein